MGVGEFLALLTSIVGVGVAAVSLLLRMEGRVKRVETIVGRELVANGGDSLRDRVVRMEARLWAQDHHTAQHVERDM